MCPQKFLRSCLLTYSLWLGLSALGLRADSVLLTPVADTSLLQVAPNDNAGGNASLLAGSTGNFTTNRALLKFDLREIPPSSVITSVKLTLCVTRVPGNGSLAVDSTFELHRMLKDWGEGNKIGSQGSPASAGEATWNCRFNDTNVWTSPGTQAGTDYAEAVSASQFVSGTNGYRFGPSGALAADLQQWLDNPAVNFGWILVSGAEAAAYTARRFGSREDTAHMPQLTVDYLPPPPHIDSTGVSGTEFTMRFQALSGYSYVVQQRPWLSASTWEIYTNLPPAPTNRTATVSAPLTVPQQFYRLGRQLP